MHMIRLLFFGKRIFIHVFEPCFILTPMYNLSVGFDFIGLYFF